MIKSIRYPRYNTPNPSVTCYVVNLNVLKYINLIPLILPEHLDGDFYIGNMFWISNQELTLTYTSRDQTLSSTVLCKAPLFECVEVSRIRNFITFSLSERCGFVCFWCRKESQWHPPRLNHWQIQNPHWEKTSYKFFLVSCDKENLWNRKNNGIYEKKISLSVRSQKILTNLFHPNLGRFV